MTRVVTTEIVNISLHPGTEPQVTVTNATSKAAEPTQAQVRRVLEAEHHQRLEIARARVSKLAADLHACSVALHEARAWGGPTIEPENPALRAYRDACALDLLLKETT